MSGQRRHESPDVGDAIVRMLRGLVTRAAEGDTEAVAQLARVEQLAGVATTLGGRLAHDEAGYSYTQLGSVLGVSRQAARQRALNVSTGRALRVLADVRDAAARETALREALAERDAEHEGGYCHGCRRGGTTPHAPTCPDAEHEGGEGA